ncbi:MAG: sugar ABC transporter ATP-binding protein [Clostridia bacterium]|nr:sugar ABC transporter ATP-binding protein [Clostridia bacterium]
MSDKGQRNILEMKSISKAFPGVHALKKVDFAVLEGEVHCLIGANGAGKSTLMKILSGAYIKDEGEIFFAGKSVNINNPTDSKKLGISIIYQELSLVTSLSASENIFLGHYPQTARCLVDWRTINGKAQQMIDEMGIEIDVKKPVSSLSIGKRQIVELAKALVAEAKLVVMDEPSATLSSEEFETLVKVIRDLKAKGITVIYISHRLEELFRVGDRVTVLRDGTYVGTKVLKEMDHDELVEMIIGYTLSKEVRKSGEITGEKLLDIRNISTPKLHSVSLAVHKGEVLGLYGLVGSGRTEVLRVIYGADRPQAGTMFFEGKKVQLRSPVDSLKLGIGMVPENRKTQGLIMDLPVWENAALPSLKNFSKFGKIQYGILFNEVQELVKKLRVATPSITTSVKNLSGGNQQKVVVAKWLLKKSHMLLFDEPTQGIDIGAKEEIYGIIKEVANMGYGVLVASSELSELMQVCDRILVMFNGEVAGQFTRDSYQEEAILKCAVTGR